MLQPLYLRLQGLAEKPPRFGRSAMRQACALLKVGLNEWWEILEAYDSYDDVKIYWVVVSNVFCLSPLFGARFQFSFEHISQMG